MLFTVAIPTYNNESTIVKAIESALNQDFEDEYEIVIVNNNSSDNTSKVLETIKSGKVKVYTNPETYTLFENHNACLRVSRGDYVLFCHSDDELDVQALSILKRKIEERGYPKKYIVWGHSFFRDFSTALTNAKLSVGQTFAGIVAVRPFINGGLTPSGTCYSKSFIEHNGFLPTNHKLTPSDSSSMIHAALNGFRFEMINELLFYRRDASTLLRGTKLNDKKKAYTDAYDQLIPMITKDQAYDLVMQSGFNDHVNLDFYNYFMPYFTSSIRLILLKKIIKKPTVMRFPSFWRILLSSLLRKKIVNLDSNFKKL